jgi:hypothetical protein
VPLAMKSMISKYEGTAGLLTIGPLIQHSPTRSLAAQDGGNAHERRTGRTQRVEAELEYTAIAEFSPVARSGSERGRPASNHLKLGFKIGFNKRPPRGDSRLSGFDTLKT